MPSAEKKRQNASWDGSPLLPLEMPNSFCIRRGNFQLLIFSLFPDLEKQKKGQIRRAGVGSGDENYGWKQRISWDAVLYLPFLLDQYPPDNHSLYPPPPSQLPTCVLPAGVEFYPSGFDSNDSSTFPKSYPIVFTGSRQVSLVMEGSLIRSAIGDNWDFTNFLAFSCFSKTLWDVISYIVSNVPFPIPGKDLVLSAIEKCLLSVEAPPKDGLPHVEISFQPLVQCLDVDNLLKRFTAVFLERRILLRSNKYLSEPYRDNYCLREVPDYILIALNSASTLLCYAYKNDAAPWVCVIRGEVYCWFDFLGMLEESTSNYVIDNWHGLHLDHVYIPLLFFIGVDYFDAPTPYMTGLHSSIGTPCNGQCLVVIVNLEYNRICTSEEIPPTPVPGLSTLRGEILKLLYPNETGIDQMKAGLVNSSEQYFKGCNKPWGEEHYLQLSIIFTSILGLWLCLLKLRATDDPLSSFEYGMQEALIGGSLFVECIRENIHSRWHCELTDEQFIAVKELFSGDGYPLTSKLVASESKLLLLSLTHPHPLFWEGYFEYLMEHPSIKYGSAFSTNCDNLN
uniref:UDENN domain-containing protein n=1 Tax=Salix viminalis TaxID=40686 RepID=A0A6N2L7W8_SALVM